MKRKVNCILVFTYTDNSNNKDLYIIIYTFFVTVYCCNTVCNNNKYLVYLACIILSTNIVKALYHNIIPALNPHSTTTKQQTQKNKKMMMARCTNMNLNYALQ